MPADHGMRPLCWLYDLADTVFGEWPYNEGPELKTLLLFHPLLWIWDPAPECKTTESFTTCGLHQTLLETLDAWTLLQLQWDPGGLRLPTKL